MRKGRTLVRGTLLLTLSGLALRGLGVLFQAVLAKRVGAAGMGVLQLVLTVGGFAGTLGSAGVRTAALQLAARAWGRGDRPGFTASLLACLRYGLLASAAAGAGLILLAAPLSELLLRDGRTVPALRTLGILLPLPILAGVLRAIYTACGRVKELAAVELTERLLSLGVTFLLLALAGSDPARVCAAVIGGSYGTSVFSCLVLLLRLRGSLPGAGPLPPVARRALPLGLNDCLRSGLGTVEQFLIPWGLERSGSRTAALAAYGTVSGMVFPLLWFPAEGIFALSELMVSELARLLAKKEHRRMKRLVRKSLGLTALYALGIFAALWLGGGVLGRALFKSEQAGRYLRIFAAMVLFLYPDAVVDGLQKGLGQQLHLVRYNSFTNVIDVLGLWLLLPRYGLAGYIFTYCLSHLVNFFLSLRRLLIVVENPELCE
ncbi:MAG: oligosaccharide flippase family protein [Oscillospiraceae bacterium]|nr:oligosaccharide flippase family protein [Oscillospiraceae bacterium]